MKLQTFDSSDGRFDRLAILHARTVEMRVAELRAVKRGAEKIALEILDLHGAGRVGQKAAESVAPEQDSAQFQRLSTNGVSDRIANFGTGAHDRRVENAYDLVRQLCFINLLGRRAHGSSRAV